MERTQQILLHRILQADLVCDLMIEDFVNVPAFQIVVSFIRGCGHTKPQLWFEIVQDFFVAVGGAVMGFVDYDCIKCVLLIAVQVLLFAKNSDHPPLFGQHQHPTLVHPRRYASLKSIPVVKI